MKKRMQFVALWLVLCLSLSMTAFAHSGRTDSNGGHKDNKNVSGLGSYHYHHGYGPHLHTDGICPYDTPAPAPVQKAKPQTCVSNIGAYIDNQFISSVNYKDSTFVVASDLNNYGFDVVWDSASRSLRITANPDKKIEPSAASNTEEIFEVEDTDIKAYLCDNATGARKEITSYNIGGRTIVKFSELGKTTWDGDTRCSYLNAA